MNGVVVASQTFTTNLKGGRSDVFSLPTQTLAPGTNVLKYYTSNPNGVLDSINTNDTLKMTINFQNTTPPVTVTPTLEGFEDPAFDPTINGWSVVNQTSGTNTWTRTTSAYKTGTAAASIKLFGNTATGDYDYLKSPYLNFANTNDTPYISFNYAISLTFNFLDILSLLLP